MALTCFDSPELEALPFEEIVDCDGVQQESVLWRVVHSQHDTQVSGTLHLAQFVDHLLGWLIEVCYLKD